MIWYVCWVKRLMGLNKEFCGKWNVMLLFIHSLCSFLYHSIHTRHRRLFDLPLLCSWCFFRQHSGCLSSIIYCIHGARVRAAVFKTQAYQWQNKDKEFHNQHPPHVTVHRYQTADAFIKFLNIWTCVAFSCLFCAYSFFLFTNQFSYS